MEISRDLLKRYLDDQCTPQERERVERFLESEKNKPSNLPDELADQMKAAFWKNIEPLVQEDHTTSDKDIAVVPLHRALVRYAAAAVIVLTLGFLGYNYFSASNPAAGQLTQLANLKTISTQRGEKRTVTLSDGSTIRMNYETKIQAPERFEGAQRVVHLSGHAHFDVVKDRNRPFIIYTEDSKTQVLGTSFDINTKKEGKTEIIVTSGKVAFSEKENTNNLVTLSVNDQATLRADAKIDTKPVNAEKLTAWKDNRLVFDNMSFREIIAIVEPWYDVNIKVDDTELLQRHFKFSYQNPSLDNLMQRMSNVAGFDYRIEGKQVNIYR